MKKFGKICKAEIIHHVNRSHFCSKTCFGTNKRIDISGKRFGRLIAISQDIKKGFWLFKCDCGKEKSTWKNAVIRGKIKSCGCIRTEILKKRCSSDEWIKAISERTTRHGFTKIKAIPIKKYFHIKYDSMKTRCENRKNKSFHSYGGRGIKCLWNSFEEFRDDMFASYQEHVKIFGKHNTTIDRIDNNGNYCKENCRWITIKEQARNHRNNKFIEFNNEIKCLAEWAEIFGIKQPTLWNRLFKHKYSIKNAFTIPTKR